MSAYNLILFSLAIQHCLATPLNRNGHLKRHNNTKTDHRPQLRWHRTTRRLWTGRERLDARYVERLLKTAPG